MPYSWDRAKPEKTNVKTWRRLQVEQYVKIHPTKKPRDVLEWIQSHNPNPWPTCDTNNLGKIMRRLSKSSIRTKFEPTENLTFSSQVMISKFKPLMVE